MKKIELSHNLFAVVDDEDFDSVNNYHWKASPSTNKYYARTFLKDINTKKKRTSLLLQHLVVGKAPKGKRIFFKDGNPLNCQKCNIEFISNSEASHRYYKKTKTNKNATETFRGVIVQFIARIKYKNKIITLGNFTNEKDAANAYNIKARELYGERAVLNLL